MVQNLLSDQLWAPALYKLACSTLISFFTKTRGLKIIILNT